MLALKALTGSTGTWFGDSVPDGSPPPTTDGWIDQHRVVWSEWAPLSGVWYIARVGRIHSFPPEKTPRTHLSSSPIEFANGSRKPSFGAGSDKRYVQSK